MNFFKRLLGLDKRAQKEVEYMPVVTATEHVNRLESLGYYKYADPLHLAALKEDLIDAFHKYGVLSTWEEQYVPFAPPLEYRYYPPGW